MHSFMLRHVTFDAFWLLLSDVGTLMTERDSGESIHLFQSLREIPGLHNRDFTEADLARFVLMCAPSSGDKRDVCGRGTFIPTSGSIEYPPT